MVRLLCVLFGALVLTVAASADDADKYGDIKAVFAGVATAVDTLAQDIDQANDAPSVAQAFTKFGDSMKAFKKSIDELQTKYPELADDKKEPPAELKDSLANMQASFGKFKAIMQKADPYMNDPAVQEAIKKMKGAM